MDPLWLAAPGPAVKLWVHEGAVRWQPNPAALEWSLRLGHADADWLALAGRLLAALPGDTPPATTTGAERLRSSPLRWTAVPMQAAWLVWLAPVETPAPQSGSGWGHLAHKLELLQSVGRMGMFERDLRSGHGRWDRHMFRLMRMAPTLRPPPRASLLERVHPDDRARFSAEYQASLQSPGRRELRYRLRLQDGDIRELHSICEVLADAEGRPAVMVGVVVDDTEAAGRVREQQALSSKLAEALNLADTMVWRIDLGRRWVRYNVKGYAAGALPSEVPPPTFDGFGLDHARSFAHPDDLQGLLRADEAALHRHGAVDVECRFRDAAGGYRHMLTRRVAERDAQGQVIALTGVSLDLTAQVLERDKASALARSLEQISQATGVGLWSIDMASGSEEWNPQMFRIHGLPEAPVAPGMRRWLDELVHPLDRQRLGAEWQRATEAEAAEFAAEFRILRPDGTGRWVSTRVVRARQDGRTMLHGILLDVSDRRAIEAALKQQQERLALATRAAGLGIWERSLDGQVLYWDEQMYRLHGQPPGPPQPAEAVWRAGAAEGDFDAVLARTGRPLAQGEVHESELQQRWPDGSVHWLHSIGMAARDEHGVAVRMAGVCRDVTERKLAEQAVRDKEAAERTSRAKSELLARMSHELRTPLNAMMGFAQLVAQDRGRSIDALQLERLGRVHSAGTHLLSMIDDVLDLSAIEARTLPLQLEAVPLPEVIAQVLRWVSPLAAAAGVALHVRHTPAWVHADPRRLRQVLANVLGSAVRRQPSGGQVWLSAEAADSRAAHGAQVCVAVRDDGPGLTAAQRARLFEPFSGASADRDSGHGGIGLVVAHHLVQLMRGHVEVDSDAGRGTELRVWLPQHPANGAAPSGEAMHGQAGAGARHRMQAAGVAAGAAVAGATTGGSPAMNGASDGSGGKGGKGGGSGGSGGVGVGDGGSGGSGGRGGHGRSGGEGGGAMSGPDPRAEPSAAAPPAGRLSVLYIEDNAVNVLLVQELVAMRPNVAFSSAPDGLSGVARALADRPDVVLVDMQLPDIDGFEVLQRLKASPAMQGSDLIALSANAMPEDVARARSAGFDDYWTKPIDFNQFLASLDRLAASRG